MRRNTKIKLAALVTTVVATFGVVATGPIASADAGQAPVKTSQMRGIEGCC